MANQWKLSLVHDLRQRNLRVSQLPREHGDERFGCVIQAGGPTATVATLIVNTASLQNPAMTTVRDVQVSPFRDPDSNTRFYRVSFVFRA